MKRILPFVVTLILAGCSLRAPTGVEPVGEFDLHRYLGRWYEIARLDHRFERGLTRVSANYTLREDGGIDVLNRGFNSQSGKWSEAMGRAYFISDPTVASLKVSFFGPFYGGYHVIDLDRDGYSWALISGPGREYLWILSRTPQLDPARVQTLVAQAQALGYATENLIYVEQE